LPERARADDAAIRQRDIAHADALPKGSGYGLPQGRVGVRPVEALAEHHSKREDLSDWIGAVRSTDVTRSPMSGLICRVSFFVEVAGVGKAARGEQQGSTVGEHVAE